MILRHQLAIVQRRQPRHPKLNWADRALIAILLSVIPRARRHGLRLLVTPDRILRWHRDIVRRRWTARSIRGKTGRPATRRNIKALVRRLARENPEWGYRRIHGELAGLAVADLQPGETVLDLGSGGGIDVLLSGRRVGPAGKAYGLDMTDEMLNLSRDNAARAGATNAEFLNGHIESIPSKPTAIVSRELFRSGAPR